MDIRTAKSIAARRGCDLWWSPEFQSWALHKAGELEVEGSGGRWMSANNVKDHTKDSFAALCTDISGI